MLVDEGGFDKEETRIRAAWAFFVVHMTVEGRPENRCRLAGTELHAGAKIYVLGGRTCRLRHVLWLRSSHIASGA